MFFQSGDLKSVVLHDRVDDRRHTIEDSQGTSLLFLGRVAPVFFDKGDELVRMSTIVIESFDSEGHGIDRSCEYFVLVVNLMSNYSINKYFRPITVLVCIYVPGIRIFEAEISRALESKHSTIATTTTTTTTQASHSFAIDAMDGSVALAVAHQKATKRNLNEAIGRSPDSANGAEVNTLDAIQRSTCISKILRSLTIV